MQSFIQLLAVLFFYYYYKIIFRRNLIFTAVLLIGYVTSNVNLYYDSAYHPDSLMGSLFIIEIAMLIRLIHKPGHFYFFLLAIVATYSISVRANGIIILPLLLIYLVYTARQSKSFKIFGFNLFLLSIPLLLLSLFYFRSPIYKSFNLVPYPAVSVVDSNVIMETNENPTWKSLIDLNLSKNIYPENRTNIIPVYNDTAYAIYVVAYQRWYLLNLDKDTNLMIENFTDTRSLWSKMNLDTCFKEGSIKKENKYLSFKN